MSFALRNLEQQNILRQELNNSVEMLRQERLQYSNTLQQEINNAIEMLRQEQLQYSNTNRQELNNAIEMLRQEQLQYSTMFRQEINNSVEMLRMEDRNITTHATSSLTQDTEKKINNTALELVESLLRTRWMLARNDFVHYQSTPKNDRVLKNAKSLDIYLEKFRKFTP